MDVFISYSHCDTEWKDLVVGHLDQMRMAGVLRYASWDDGHINAGDKWDEVIHTAMQQATVAVLLVSSDFLTSDYIMTTEKEMLLARESTGELAIIPVMIRHSAWTRFEWLSEREHFPKGKVLSGMARPELEAALTDLVEVIAQRVEDGRVPNKQEDADEASDGHEPGAPGPLGEDLTATRAGGSSGASTEASTGDLTEASTGDSTGDLTEASTKASTGPSDALTPEASSRSAAVSGAGLKGKAPFLTEDEVREIVTTRVRKPVRQALKVFRTKTQRTWFVAVEGMIVCLLDDARTRSSNRLVQWKEPVGPLTEVRVKKKRDSDWLAHAQVGRRQRWLVNLRLFQDDEAHATQALEALRDAARG